MVMLPASTQPEGRGGTLSGARADFVAQLGRRVGELRVGLQGLEADPTAMRPRDDLKRRMHALGSAARVLKFHALADEMVRLEQLLVRSAAENTLDAARLAAMRSDVDALVGLAWGEAADSRRFVLPQPSSSEIEPAAITWPATALVVGDASLAEGLLPEMSAPGDVMLDCERVADTSEALEMARALAPDVVVLDAELPGSHDLVERLSSDPLTEPVPVVVVGTFSSSDKAARWVALGVARVLARPFTPRQLQEACSSVVTSAHRALRPEPFGQLTLDQLVERLSEELKRGLSDGALDHGRKIPLPLGDGHEVMAALWSAIVRIREVTTIRSGGMVRFQQLGPEGAVAVASWGSDSRAGRPARSLEAPDNQRLDNRVVLVVDDDPSVTWFLSGVLRAAGATVIEAHDGEAALRLAYRHCPDLVISDILMPKLDGFALCRALKRDVVLRDAPVILLSWKEDLLQRVRELGANADGYLRKEASAAVVLERIFEVLRPRLRVERRLESGSEVRGRLDDLTVRTLLAQVSRLQPNARVSVRDAAYLYELEIRAGAPRSATRTTPDGRFERGPGVLFSLLGVGAGRFVVAPSDAPLRGWLDGSLSEQLRPAVAQIRAAQRLLSGTSLMNVQGVDLHLEAIQPYFESSPGTPRGILDKLAEGFSPRALLLRGGYSARILEDVLNDAILHGGVARVVGTGGEDLLPPAVEQEMALMEQGVALSPSMSPEAPAAAFYAEYTPSPVQLPADLLAQASEDALIQGLTSSERPGDLADAAEAARPTVEPAAEPAVGPAAEPAAELAQAALAALQAGAEDHGEAAGLLLRAPTPSPSREVVQLEASTIAPSWSRLPAAPSPIESALMDASPSAPLVIPVATASQRAPEPPREQAAPETKVAPEPAAVPAPVAEPAAPVAVSAPVAPEAPLAPAAVEAAPAVAAAQGVEAPEQRPTPPPAPRSSRHYVSPLERGVVPPIVVEPFLPSPSAMLPPAEGARSAPEAPPTGARAAEAEEVEEAPSFTLGTPLQNLTPAPVVSRPEPIATTTTESAPLALPVVAPASEAAVEQPTTVEQPAEVSRETSLRPEDMDHSPKDRPSQRIHASAESKPARRAPRETRSVAEEPAPPAEEPASPKSKGSWGWVIGVLVLVMGGSGWALRGGSKSTAQSTSAPTEATRAASVPESTTKEKETETASAGGDSNAPRSLGVEDLPLAPGEAVADGQGLLEVMAGRRDDILVDRREAGKGPEVKVTLPPGVHEIRSRRKGDDQPLTVVVRAGRRTKVDLRGPWRR